jgi:WD40 repeat protein
MPAEITKLTVAKEINRPEILLSLARVPNTDRLFLGASDGKVYEVDPLAEKPEFKPHEGHTSFVTGLVIAGEFLISGSYDGKLIWRKLESGEIVRTIDAAHARWIRKVAVSADGQRIASVADDMVCRVWDVETGRCLHELRGHAERTPNHFPSMLYTCAISPDGRGLATADRVGQICVWDLTAGSELARLQAPGFYTWDPKQRIHSIGGIRSLAFSPDSKTLVAGGIGRIGNIDHLDGPARVEAFDWQKGEKLHEFSGDGKGLIETLAFDPEGRWLLGLGGDNGGLLQAYDLVEKKVVRSEKAPMHIHAAVLNEASDKLFAAGHGRVVVWDLG